MTDKIRICFVDDEPNILQGLKRFMRPMTGEWDMEFHLSGDAALLSMQQTGPFDVVVSDMRMPGMDGAALLAAVRRDYPQTVRVILSGYADNDSILRTIGPAHVYLAKPCDGDSLRRAVQHPLALRRLLASDSMRTALGGLESLPTLPELYVRLDQELRSPNSSTASVARIIAADTAMTAEILKLTNSAYFGIGRSVDSVLQAVRTLGLETIQTLILKTAFFRQFSGSPRAAPFLEGLNRHGLIMNKLAKKLAAALDFNETRIEAAGCTAMLSNVGALILLDSLGETYLHTLSKVGPDLPVHLAEIRDFGVHHGHVGAYLLGLWGFSDEVVEAVAHAPAPWDAGRFDNRLLGVLHLTRTLGPSFPPLPPGIRDERRPDMDYLEKTGIAGRLPELEGAAREVFGEAAP